MRGQLRQLLSLERAVHGLAPDVPQRLRLDVAQGEREAVEDDSEGQNPVLNPM